MTPLRIFDTHAHYDDDRFDGDREEVLLANRAAGVVGIVNCAVDYASSAACQRLADGFDFCYAAVGVHPENIPGETVDIAPLYDLSRHPKTVAIGEIGLDYHYEDGAPREVQMDWFAAQLRVASKLEKPVIVHDRDAHGDTLVLLKSNPCAGVLHCFSGSVEMAKEIVGLGMYIGVGGTVTFKNARKLPDVIRAVGLDRLLLETDAPYLAPEPFRGHRCESRFIEYTAAAVADILGTTADKVLAKCEENARRLFKIPPADMT